MVVMDDIGEDFVDEQQEIFASSEIFDNSWKRCTKMGGCVETSALVYPSFVNRTEVRRPVGADDGEPILALHDVEMLSYF